MCSAGSLSALPAPRAISFVWSPDLLPHSTSKSLGESFLCVCRGVWWVVEVSGVGRPQRSADGPRRGDTWLVIVSYLTV